MTDSGEGPTSVQKVNQIVNHVVNDIILTPIDVLIERSKTTTRGELIERLNATSAELIKIQYQLREMAVVAWYQEQDDLRQHLHHVFERHIDFFKAGSVAGVKEGDKPDNWLILSTQQTKPIKGVEEFIGGKLDDRGPYYFTYFKDQETMKNVIDKMRVRDQNKMLCVPLFKAS
jgi:hypothetical protein